MNFFSLFKKQKTNTTISITPFECKRGSLTIRGTEYRPAGNNLPIAIISHGFMATQNSVSQYAESLAKAGYASYCFDFCGGCLKNGKSDGDTTEMSALTETKDLEAVISYAKSLSYTDSDSLLLMGCSQGGFVSALTAAKEENLVKKLVLIFPAFCIPHDARAGQMMFAKFDPKDIPETFYCGDMKLGRCYAQDVLEMDPFVEIKPYKGQVLIIHGTDDELVHPDYSERAQEAYLKSLPEGMRAKERCRLIMIDHAGHGFNAEQDKAVMQLVKKFAR